MEKNNYLAIDFSESGFEMNIEGNKDKLTLNEQRIVMDYYSYKQDIIFDLGFYEVLDTTSLQLMYLYKLASYFLQLITEYPLLEFERENINIELDIDTINKLISLAPYANGNEFINEAWIRNIHKLYMNYFIKEIKEFNGTINEYLLSKNKTLNIVGRIFFHLAERNDTKYPFAFLATYSTKSNSNSRALHLPLIKAIEEFKDDTSLLIQLLSSVTKVSASSTLISGLLDSGKLFHTIKLNKDEAYQFLKEINIYKEAGIMCRVPNWWKNKQASPTIRVKIGDDPVSKIGLDAILDFRPKISIQDIDLSEAELRSFLKMSDGLLNFKGKWIEINHDKILEVLNAIEQIEEIDDFTIADLIRFNLGLKSPIDGIFNDNIEITNGQWLNSFMNHSFNDINNISVPSNLKANLRDYQKQGFDYLTFMYQMDMGSLLADDMGLGKTIQVIALLLSIYNKKAIKTLIVLPASLIANWSNELTKFAPDLKYRIIHKDFNKNELSFEENIIYLTTYGYLDKIDTELFFDFVILDEAQAIKNPGTKQTKLIKAIKKKHTLALTGTPIENRLVDLWSLFDFINPGLLGSSREFTKFTKELFSDYQNMVKLKQMVNPFILRRLKSDKSIINDLPEKIENKEYIALTTKQVSLYQKLLNDIEDELDDNENRQSLILASISKFKEICNHPDQYLGLDEYKVSASGKFERLIEICETIKERHERVLVFTQYKSMCEPLRALLSTVFNHKGLVLHGSTSIKDRGKIVDEFNSEEYSPFMILSLKAGGTGLNLVKASHVIHFDRWWNPAVENQATDRAYRIGQNRNVIVYKFISKGTIEDKIDTMIEEKTKLASDILTSESEAWITKLSNTELINLFKLEGDK